MRYEPKLLFRRGCFTDEGTLSVCDSCQKGLLHTAFSSQMQAIWQEGRDEEVECLQCERGEGKRKRTELEFVVCQFCPLEREKRSRWPETAFETAKLQRWKKDEQLHLVQCAACVIRLEHAEKLVDKIKCQLCGELKPFTGPPGGFPPVLLRP